MRQQERVLCYHDEATLAKLVRRNLANVYAVEFDTAGLKMKHAKEGKEKRALATG